MSIEERLSNLEKLVDSLIKRIDNDKFYDSADKQGIRQTEGNHGEAIDKHTDDISQNSADIDFIAMEAGIDLEE